MARIPTSQGGGPVQLEYVDTKGPFYEGLKDFGHAAEDLGILLTKQRAEDESNAAMLAGSQALNDLQLQIEQDPNIHPADRSAVFQAKSTEVLGQTTGSIYLPRNREQTLQKLQLRQNEADFGIRQRAYADMKAGSLAQFDSTEKAAINDVAFAETNEQAAQRALEYVQALNANGFMEESEKIKRRTTFIEKVKTSQIQQMAISDPKLALALTDISGPDAPFKEVPANTLLQARVRASEEIDRNEKRVSKQIKEQRKELRDDRFQEILVQSEIDRAAGVPQTYTASDLASDSRILSPEQSRAVFQIMGAERTHLQTSKPVDAQFVADITDMMIRNPGPAVESALVKGLADGKLGPNTKLYLSLSRQNQNTAKSSGVRDATAQALDLLEVLKTPLEADDQNRMPALVRYEGANTTFQGWRAENPDATPAQILDKADEIFLGTVGPEEMAWTLQLPNGLIDIDRQSLLEKDAKGFTAASSRALLAQLLAENDVAGLIQQGRPVPSQFKGIAPLSLAEQAANARAIHRWEKMLDHRDRIEARRQMIEGRKAKAPK